METGTIVWILFAVIIAAGLVIASVLGMKGLKGITATRNKINETLAPVQHDLTTIKEEQASLTNHQQKIQQNVQHLTEQSKIIVNSVKQAPTKLKKQWKDTQID